MMSTGHFLMIRPASVGVDGAAGLFVIYNNILDEDIGDFRVALLPRRIPEVGKKIVLPVQPVPPQPPVAI